MARSRSPVLRGPQEVEGLHDDTDLALRGPKTIKQGRRMMTMEWGKGRFSGRACLCLTDRDPRTGKTRRLVWDNDEQGFVVAT
jgi:hypothetical protein